MLYHRAARDVRGDTLYPLNELRERHPEVYAREAAKYVGREALRRERVAPLDCEWGDVLFFSPVPPGPLLEAVRAGGRAAPPIRFWTVSAAQLDPARACIHFARPWPDGVYTPPTAQDYAPWTPEVLAQVCAPPPATLTRLGQLAPDAPLILWLDVPHVLYRGTLALDTLREVRA